MTKSRIFLYLCLSFVLGVFVESLVKFSLPVLGGFFILGIILASVFWKSSFGGHPERSLEPESVRGGRVQGEVEGSHEDIAVFSFLPDSRIFSKKIVVFGLCLLFFCFGGWRCLQKDLSSGLSQFNDKGRLVLTGLVAEETDKRAASQKLVVEAESVIVGRDEINISGRSLITTGRYPEFQYGDYLQITGQLEEPRNFQDFDYKSYLAKSDIYSVVYYPEIKILAQNQGHWFKSSLFWLKGKFETALEKSLPEPQASFLGGLVLGQNKQLPSWFSQALKKTGTTHIVALSGYNITMISSFIMTIFGLLMLPKRLRFWLAVLGIMFFTILTGAAASVVRSAIMGVLILVARQEGRLYSVRNALIFAGATMIFLNPKILRFDIGFQLSFGATAGLIWLAPVFEKWLKKIPRLLGLKEILIATLSAQLAVLPLLLVYFGQLSLVAPLANLAVLLFIPLTMLIGFICGGLGMIWLAAGKVFGWLAWLFLTLEIKIIEFFASLPLSAVAWRWDWGAVGIYYLIIILLLVRFQRIQKKQILVEMWAE